LFSHHTLQTKKCCLCRHAKWRSMNWSDRVQDMDKWSALANTAINLWIPYTARNSITSWGTATFSNIILFKGVSYLVHAHFKSKTAEVIYYFMFFAPYYKNTLFHLQDANPCGTGIFF
jgi:hypothetical protein